MENLDATKTTGVLDFTERLAQKRARDELEKTLNYVPTIEEIMTFLRVLDWVRFQSSTNTVSIDTDEINLGVAIYHQTDENGIETDKVSTAATLSVYGSIDSSYSFITNQEGGDESETERAEAFNELIEQLSIDNFPDDGSEDEDAAS